METAYAKKKTRAVKDLNIEIIFPGTGFNCYCLKSLEPLDPLEVQAGDRIFFTGAPGVVVFGDRLTEPPIGQVPTLPNAPFIVSSEALLDVAFEYFPIVSNGTVFDLCEDCPDGRGPRPTMIVRSTNGERKRGKKNNGKKRKNRRNRYT